MLGIIEFTITSWRETSIKTRIETTFCILITILTYLLVEEKHPLKQGLKHEKDANGKKIKDIVEEKHPLKQGLKP